MHLPDNTELQGGKYRIVRFISSGGFGCTYEGFHDMMDERIAIKEFFVSSLCNRDSNSALVSIGVASNRKLIDKLKRKFVEEARAVRKLRHPNIVSVHDVFDENGTSYFVMDYIDGPSLNDIVKSRGALPQRLALKFVTQIAEALEYVHAHNRLHLDIKPANIMLAPDKRAVLIDFGVSKQYDEEDGENTSTLLGATPGYAPIEQIGNNVVTFSPATDIYSLGATLYKLLTGVTPLPANLIAGGDEVAPLPGNVYPSVREAVECAMKLSRKDRPQTAREFIDLMWKGVPKETSEESAAQEIALKSFLDQHAKSRAKNPEQIQVLKIQKGGEAKKELTEIKRNDRIENSNQLQIEAVDLGLSVKWASHNIGAERPSDNGDYFAWGETKPISRYTEENSRWHGVSSFKVEGNILDKLFRKNKSKNNLLSMGVIDGNGNLTSQYDAATANWGGSWRMPTKEEIQELLEKCKWTWTTRDGHKGYLVTGPNGNSIFLPAAGYRSNDDLINAGLGGYYWSSSAYSGEKYSYDLYSDWSLQYLGSSRRYYGQSVRPVTE